MATSAINFTGLGSGIDTSSIIQKLMAVEQQPLQLLQQQQAVLQSKQAIFQQFQTQLQSIATAASALATGTAFQTVASTSSDTTVASITNDPTAVAGSYSLSVTQLAQAQKISSSAKIDTTSALNLTPGTFVVNGKQISVDGSDSLRSIAQKINGASAGVTASLIDGGAGSAYLTLTSQQSGKANSISLTDLTGTTLSSLGLSSGTTNAIRETITGGATSTGFADQNATLQTLMPGLPASMTITVNGTAVSVDTTTDSLSSLANKLSTVANVTATVRSVTQNGQTIYKLDVKGTDGTTPTFTNDTLASALGLTKPTYSNQLVGAQDANYTLDSIPLTSSSNTITTAIPGATLTLLKGTLAAPGTSTLSLTNDTTGTISKIQDLVTAYNNTVDFISQQSQFDTTSFQSGPLFGDAVSEQVQDSLSQMVTQAVPGTSGLYTSLQNLGFSIDDSNHLTFDQTKLSTALASDPTSVARIFQATGSSTAAGLGYVSSTSKTRTAGAGSYAVNITQAATVGSYTGEVAQTTASSYAEILSFNGALFGNTVYKVTLASGSTAADAVRTINSDSKLTSLVSASLDSNGKLIITSKKYGSNGNFTVGSDHEASTDNSGIGFGSAGVAVQGLDVAGTINGEATTGSGQFLTGNAGDANVDGLQISYTGSATGLIGNIGFTKGVASSLTDLISSFTDPTNGLLTSTLTSLSSEIDDMTQEAADMQARLNETQQELQDKYNNMEAVISQLQSQSAQLSAMQGTTTTGK